jgi:hypothetical protein
VLGTGITAEAQLGTSKTWARWLLTKIRPIKFLTASQTFHWTTYGRVQEITTRAPREPRKLEPLIWWLKTRPGFTYKSPHWKKNQNRWMKISNHIGRWHLGQELKIAAANSWAAPSLGVKTRGHSLGRPSHWADRTSGWREEIMQGIHQPHERRENS